MLIKLIGKINQVGNFIKMNQYFAAPDYTLIKGQWRLQQKKNFKNWFLTEFSSIPKLNKNCFYPSFFVTRFKKTYDRFDNSAGED